MEYWERLFWLCLALSLLSLAVAVWLFFALHIRTVLEEITRLQAVGPGCRRKKGKAPIAEKKVVKGCFILEREIMVIHTQEEL